MGGFAESLNKYFEETSQDILDDDRKAIKPLNDSDSDVIDIERVRIYL